MLDPKDELGLGDDPMPSDPDYTREDHEEFMDRWFEETVMDDLAWWGFKS